MKKRFLSILLALCMVLTLFPVYALAEDSDFVIENGVLTKYTGPGNGFNSSGVIVTIPSGVTSIGYRAFYQCHGVTSVTFPDSVISIENEAFCECSGLTSITIPSSVTTIGVHAFGGCSSLTNVTISNGVTSIGEAAFCGCSGLTSISVPNSVNYMGRYVFSNCINLTSAGPVGGGYDYEFGWDKEIPANAFSECSELINVKIPSNITMIGDSAFWGCKNLTSAGPIGGGYDYEFGWTKEIPANAFAGCHGLTSINIPSSIRKIGAYAFSGCMNMKSVIIPNGVTSIERDTFAGCEQLTEVTIPKSVSSIGIRAFCGCSSLTNLTIPSNVASIGQIAFFGCSSLTNLTLPNNITSIEDKLFYGCSSLTNITIPDGVTSINWMAFYECSNLKYVVLPRSITNFGSTIFSNCEELKDVYYSGSQIDWTKIHITDNFFLENTTIHYNSTGPDNPSTPVDPITFPRGSSYSVKEQETIDFPVSVPNPNGLTTSDVTFISSDPTVASVEAKYSFDLSEMELLSYTLYVTGHKAGTATITASASDGRSASCTVKVLLNGSLPNDVEILLSNTEHPSTDLGKYKFTITAQITNSKRVTLKNVVATLDLDGKLKMADLTPLSQEVGDIGYGESKQVTWNVYADVPEVNTTAVYGVTASIDNAISLRKEDYIYLTAKGENDNSFILGRDQWSFPNSWEYFTDGRTVNVDGKQVWAETYFLNSVDYATLTKGRNILEKHRIDEAKNSHWGGSCYGMSVTAILAKAGIILPGSIPEGKNSIYEIQKSNNDKLESFIDFYQLQPCLDVIQNDAIRFTKKDTSEQLKILEEKAEAVTKTGIPVLLWFSGSEAHAVVAYGVEHGKFTLSDGFFGTTLWGSEYDSRILIYDPSHPDGSKESYLWYNTGTDEWCIPRYSWAKKINWVCDDVRLLDCVNHNVAVENYTAWLDFKGDATGYFLEQAGTKTLIDGSTDLRDKGLITYYDPSVTADGMGQPGPLHLILPNSTSSYSVVPFEGKASDFTLYYEDSAVSMNCESADCITFSPEGKIEATDVSGDYSVGLIFNDGYHSLPWHETSISGTDGGNVSVEQTKDGIVIEGDNLNDIIVTVENEDKTQDLRFTTDEGSVLLTEETSADGTKPIIMADSNGDGIYDEKVESYTITFNPNGGSVSSKSMTTDTEGRLAYLPTPARAGYLFAGWYTAANGGVRVNESHIYTADTTLYARWTPLHGKIAISATFADDDSSGTAYTIGGETVTLRAYPDAGYRLSSIQVIGPNGQKVRLTQKGDTYTFAMPTFDVTVCPEFTKI